MKMDEIDYLKLKFIDDLTYDIIPNKQGEMVLVFKVGDVSCALPIHKKDLKKLLSYAEQK
jgi:hypothetical protein